MSVLVILACTDGVRLVAHFRSALRSVPASIIINCATGASARLLGGEGLLNPHVRLTENWRIAPRQYADLWLRVLSGVPPDCRRAIDNILLSAVLLDDMNDEYVVHLILFNALAH